MPSVACTCPFPLIPFFCTDTTSFHSTESNSASYFLSSGFSEIHEKLSGIGLQTVFAFGRNAERFYVKVNNSQQREGFQEDTLGLEVNLMEPRVLRRLGIFYPKLKVPFFVS